MIDDLGVKASVARPVQRVVSLVPSITEAIAMTCPHVLVGCTDYCIRPTHLEEIVGHEVVRVRGTKNPDRKAIIDLRPDLVVASLTRLFEEGFGVRCPQWLEEAGREWREPCRGEVLSAVTAVWRDPWICVGKDTYISDVLRRVGIELVDLPGESRYPHVELTDIAAAHPDRVILPDEPYHFGPDDVSAFPGLDVRLVDGQKLAWYGPSMVGARRYLASALR